MSKCAFPPLAWILTIPRKCIHVSHNNSCGPFNSSLSHCQECFLNKSFDSWSYDAHFWHCLNGWLCQQMASKLFNSRHCSNIYTAPHCGPLTGPVPILLSSRLTGGVRAGEEEGFLYDSRRAVINLFDSQSLFTFRSFYFPGIIQWECNRNV